LILTKHTNGPSHLGTRVVGHVETGSNLKHGAIFSLVSSRGFRPRTLKFRPG
jgi:hypothetical protein